MRRARLTLRRLCHILDPSHPSPCGARTSRLCQHLAQFRDPARQIIFPVPVDDVECSSSRPIIVHIIAITTVSLHIYTHTQTSTNGWGSDSKTAEAAECRRGSPSFLRPGNPGNGWEKAKMEENTGKVYCNDTENRERRFSSKKRPYGQRFATERKGYRERQKVPRY